LLGRRGSAPTLPELSKSLELGLGTLHRSLGRLREAGLVSPNREGQLAQADEFFSHALRYVFPPRMRGETRGVPTIWAAPPLNGFIASGSGPTLVWAHSLGEARGIELEPLHPRVPDIALRDSELHQRFALLDALRAGDARARDLARGELQKLFVAPASR
jgi:DNA-binding transcriptional ArsR family regulator